MRIRELIRASHKLIELIHEVFRLGSYVFLLGPVFRVAGAIKLVLTGPSLGNESVLASVLKKN